jgi:hypothetical protein
MFQIAHGYSQSLINKRRFILPKNIETSLHLQNNLFRYFDFSLEKLPDIKYTTPSFEYEELRVNQIPQRFLTGGSNPKNFLHPIRIRLKIYSILLLIS